MVSWFFDLVVCHFGDGHTDILGMSFVKRNLAGRYSAFFPVVYQFDDVQTWHPGQVLVKRTFGWLLWFLNLVSCHLEMCVSCTIWCLVVCWSQQSQWLVGVASVICSNICFSFFLFIFVWVVSNYCSVMLNSGTRLHSGGVWKKKVWFLVMGTIMTRPYIHGVKL